MFMFLQMVFLSRSFMFYISVFFNWKEVCLSRNPLSNRWMLVSVVASVAGFTVPL